MMNVKEQLGQYAARVETYILDQVAAMQKGKEMETKLTFPLAVLLITLIIIAGTPALMNM